MGIKRLIRQYRARHAASLQYHGLHIARFRSGMTEDVALHILSDIYEKPEILGVGAIVRNGDRILEVGAGLGIITAIAAKSASDGQVLSFEANPEMIEDTRAFLYANHIRNVELEWGVLVPGDYGGNDGLSRTAIFHLSRSFAEGSLHESQTSTGRTVEVPAIPLSDVVSSFRPDVLICDIEGAEAELIPALDASGLRAVVIELHPHRLTRREVAAIYDHLARHGLYPMIEHSSGTVVAFERVT